MDPEATAQAHVDASKVCQLVVMFSDADVYDLGVAAGVRHDRVSQNSSTIVHEARWVLSEFTADCRSQPGSRPESHTWVLCLDILSDLAALHAASQQSVRINSMFWFHVLHSG